MANIGTDILSLPQAIMLTGSEQVPLVQGGTTKRANSAQVGQAFFTSAFPATMEYIIFGGGVPITAGTYPPGLEVPFKSVIVQGTLIANQVGSIAVDIWRCTEAQYNAGATHPAVGDSITGGNPLTIVSTTKVQDQNLVGWTTLLNAGDFLWYNVNSCVSIQKVNISLKLNRISS